MPGALMYATITVYTLKLIPRWHTYLLPVLTQNKTLGEEMYANITG